jgi:hypothetical protein
MRRWKRPVYRGHWARTHAAAAKSTSPRHPCRKWRAHPHGTPRCWRPSLGGHRRAVGVSAIDSVEITPQRDRRAHSHRLMRMLVRNCRPVQVRLRTEAITYLRLRLRLLYFTRHLSEQYAASARRPASAPTKTIRHIVGIAGSAHRPVSSRGFPDVLALEITIVRRPAKDVRGHPPAHSRDERYQPAVGSATALAPAILNPSLPTKVTSLRPSIA